VALYSHNSIKKLLTGELEMATLPLIQTPTSETEAAEYEMPANVPEALKALITTLGGLSSLLWTERLLPITGIFSSAEEAKKFAIQIEQLITISASLNKDSKTLLHFLKPMIENLQQSSIFDGLTVIQPPDCSDDDKIKNSLGLPAAIYYNPEDAKRQTVEHTSTATSSVARDPRPTVINMMVVDAQVPPQRELSKTERAAFETPAMAGYNCENKPKFVLPETPLPFPLNEEEEMAMKHIPVLSEHSEDNICHSSPNVLKVW
jgi:hypothetical protein